MTRIEMKHMLESRISTCRSSGQSPLHEAHGANPEEVLKKHHFDENNGIYTWATSVERVPIFD